MSSLWDKYPAVEVSSHDNHKEKKKKSLWDNYEDVGGGEAHQEPPERTYAQKAKRAVGQAANMIGEGLGEVLDIPATLSGLALNAVGLKDKPTFDSYTPYAQLASKGVKKIFGEDIQPENKSEEYVHEIGKALVPLGAFNKVTKGAGLLNKGAQRISKSMKSGKGKAAVDKFVSYGGNPYELTKGNIVGTAGSAAAVKSYVDNTEDTGAWGVIGSGAIGGLAPLVPGAAMKMARNSKDLIPKYVGKAVGHNVAEFERQKALGLPMSLASAADKPEAHYLETLLAKTPGAMEVVNDHQSARRTAMAGNMGIVDPTDLKSPIDRIQYKEVKPAADAYKEKVGEIFARREKKFGAREEAAYRNRERVLVEDMVSPLELERSFHSPEGAADLFDITENGKMLKKLREFSKGSSKSKSKGLAKIREELAKKGYGTESIDQIINQYSSEYPKSGHPSDRTILYKDLNSLRGLSLDRANKLAREGSTVSSGQAKNLHTTLARKRHEFMENHGSPTEKHNAKEARKFYSKYKNNMEEFVLKLTNSSNDVDAFNKLLGNEPKYLNIVRQGIPKERHEQFFESLMAKLGKSNGEFNLNSAHRNFNNMTPTTRVEVLRFLPKKSQRDTFLDTMSIINREKDIQKALSNTSNTAHTAQALKDLKGVGKAAKVLLLKADALPLIDKAFQYVVRRQGAKIWTNQNFLNRINAVMKAETPTARGNHMHLLIKMSNRLGRQGVHKEDKEEK